MLNPVPKLKRFIDIYVPIEVCNFRCPYCYVHQHRGNGSVWKNKHSIEEIRKAFSMDFLGGTCLLNVCAGGETLLYPNMIDIIEAMLSCGHYVSIITNGSLSERFLALSNFPKEYRDRLFIKFSFHWTELKRLKLFDVFWGNVHLMQSSGISFSIELAAYDGLIAEENEIKKMCLDEVGAFPHVTALRDELTSGYKLMTKHSVVEYEKIWKSYQSDLFNIRFDVIKNKNKGFCYAGAWSYTINLGSGEIRQCYQENILDNIFDTNCNSIPEMPVGNSCCSEYCYACHAFLALGVMPDYKGKYTYADVRDRNFSWLTPDMREFMSQKLYKNNKQLDVFQRLLSNYKQHKRNTECIKSESSILKETLLGIIDNNGYIISETEHYLNKIYKNRIPQTLKWIRNYNKDSRLKINTQNRNLVITATGENNEKAQGNEIWLLGCIVDEHFFWQNKFVSEKTICGKWCSLDGVPMICQLEAILNN